MLSCHAKLNATVSLSIEIAVATMELQDAAALVSHLGLSEADVDVLIINQVQGAAPAAIESDRLRVYSFQERGLSRSRNHALDLARRDLLVFADDDIYYPPGFETPLRAAFAAAPDAAILSFQVVDADTQQPVKKYAVRGHLHHALTVPRLSSVELAVRRSLLPDVRFDETFGLGSRFPSGEEAIFVADAIRAGAHARYVPLVLCSHPGASSGHRPWDEDMAHTKGAVLRRLFPRTWPVLLPAFATSKFGMRNPRLSYRMWLSSFLAGARALVR